MNAAAIVGEETRMSRPTAMRFGSNCSAYPRPMRYAPVLVELARVEAADVVGLEHAWVERHAAILWTLPAENRHEPAQPLAHLVCHTRDFPG